MVLNVVSDVRYPISDITIMRSRSGIWWDVGPRQSDPEFPDSRAQRYGKDEDPMQKVKEVALTLRRKLRRVPCTCSTLSHPRL